MEQKPAPKLEVEPAVDALVDVWDDEERKRLRFSLGALGEGVSIYGTCDRQAPLVSTVATAA